MTRFFSILIIGFIAAGCGGSKAASPGAASPDTTAKSAAAQPASADRAIAELLPTAQSQTRGMVALHMENGKLVITARVQNLKAGSYGFAVHQGDKCEPPDAKTAGAIFNPQKADKPLGFIGDLKSKGGDNQTLKINADGLALSGADSIIGHTLVLHAWPYDPSVDIQKVPFLACGKIRPDTQ
jgi:Cu-Zn family superoxide dismutase